MSFTRSKFFQLSPAHRQRALYKALVQVEQTWERGSERAAGLSAIADYLSWLGRPCPQAWSLEAVDGLLSALEAEQGLSVRDHQFLPRRGDGQREPAARSPFAAKVILHQLRSAFNSGAILRTAECMGFEEVIFSGYTPDPSHPKVAQTAMGTADKLSWRRHAQIEKLIDELQSAGVQVVALETVAAAVPLSALDLQRPTAFLLGNERYGLSAELCRRCEAVAEIPMWGWKNSLNVASAFAMASYEWGRQQPRAGVVARSFERSSDSLRVIS